MLKTITMETIEAILDALPVDVTFIDETDTIKYYNKADKNAERVLPRKSDVLGIKVQDCHKQENVPEVNRILNELKTGNQSLLDQWIYRNDRKIYERYATVRDKTGKYLGMITIVEDMTEILKMGTEQGKH